MPCHTSKLTAPLSPTIVSRVKCMSELSRLEPQNGLRALSLDGPGFDAAPQAELFFLQGIAHRWAYDENEEEERDVRVSEMFDIVGGSGIGGFYAILFTALNMTIGQVLLCHNILEDKLLSSPLWAGKDRDGCSRLLDEALDEMQSQTGVSVELDSLFRSNTPTKCFVLVQNDSRRHHPRALRNYRVRTVPSSRCTIRQALHATLANPEHLPPVVIQDEQFINACAHFPNSSRELMKELVVACPKASHLACFVNIGAGKIGLTDYSETVAQDLLSQCKDVGCFFRLSMKNGLDAGMHAGSMVKGLLEEEETSSLVDDIVEALSEQRRVIPLLRLVNLAGEDAQAKRDFQINAIHHNVEHLRDAQDQSLFRRLKDWLRPIDHARKLESSNRSRGPTTCNWFLDHPIVGEWIRTSGLCWFHGGMGTGKTFIMSHLIQTMIDQGHTVAYYYFEFTNPSTLSEEALLRSLVFQLSSIHPQSILASHEEHRGGALEPQLSTLLKCIVELARRSEQPFYIAIDALDEIPQPQRRQLLNTLKRLDMASSPNMHVIISSRDEIDIISGLGSMAQHKLDVLDGKVRHDIAVFVDQELGAEKWKHWPPDVIERMRAVLNERAAGQWVDPHPSASNYLCFKFARFRMVACQLEVFHQAQTSSDLEARLMTLPRKLADTYHYILDYLIPEEERIRAQTLLSILTVAFDAVPLNELAALIAVDLGDPSDAANLPKYQSQRRFHQPQNIVGLGTAFVRLTVHRSESSLQLSHASVKEYLLQQDSFHWCYMNEQLAHSTMAQACLALLLHNGSSYSGVPIGKYVRQRWFQHVNSNSSNQLLAQQKRYFEEFPWNEETQFQLDKYPHDNWELEEEMVHKCPLTAAVAAGLYQLSQVILATKQQQQDLDQALFVAVIRPVEMEVIELLVECGALPCGNRWGTLHAAASGGHWDMVKLFVEKGADVNDVNEGWDPILMHAVFANRLDMVEFLVEKGADVNTEAWHQSALQAAAKNKHWDVVKLLVEKGADANKAGGGDGSAMSAAAESGRLDMVEFLVEKGADVNTEDWHGLSALQAAAENKHWDVFKLLVEKGADVNEGSALWAAVESGRLDMVELLVEKGADVNKGSALRAAAKSGCLDMVELLVEKGADVNKGSALWGAAHSGRLDMVEFLLEKGADANQEGFFGSVLWAAVRRKHWDMVKLLVENGADVKKMEDFGSALQAAAETGRLDIFVLLIERSADAHRQDGKSGSILFTAGWLKSWDIVKLFLERKADVQKEAGVYRSLLRAAFWSGRLDIVELLVEKDLGWNRESGEYELRVDFWRGCFETVERFCEEGADVNEDSRKCDLDALTAWPTGPAKRQFQGDLSIEPVAKRFKVDLANNDMEMSGRGLVKIIVILLLAIMRVQFCAEPGSVSLRMVGE
ncbi:ankyrin repeat-containing domain protein [Flagelloscypha sp. PMI_526]|nr:ankyrin repeat-containing domain protein [Flagelloscypha sp. PMI_526]